jgi:hypothetical protein
MNTQKNTRTQNKTPRNNNTQNKTHQSKPFDVYNSTPGKNGFFYNNPIGGFNDKQQAIAFASKQSLTNEAHIYVVDNTTKEPVTVFNRSL